MKLVRSLIFGAAVACSGGIFFSCEDLSEINKNPNSAESVSSNYILSYVLTSSAKTHHTLGDLSQRISGTMQYSQLGTNNNAEKVNHFGWTYDAWPWNQYYDILRNVEIMRENAEKDNNRMFKAVALTLRAFTYGVATDLYGDVPYSEALNAKSGSYFPKYDEQKDIYKGILADLKEANVLLGSLEAKDGVNASADLLYKGDGAKWKKFVNSLRLRYIMRLSEKKAEMSAAGVNLDAEFADALPGAFASNADDAKMDFLGTNAENSYNGGPINSSNPNFANKIGKSFIDKLVETKDPRLERWAEPVQIKWHPSATAEKDTTFVNIFGESYVVKLRPSKGVANVDTNLYVGLPAGIPVMQALLYNRGNETETYRDERSPFISFNHARYRKNQDPLIMMNLMTYAEVKFIVAEAAARGIFGVSDADTHYKAAIKASMDKWNVGAAGSFNFDTYYAQPSVSLNGAANKWQRVMEQKWISSWLYPESWFDWRRTGYPELKAGSAAFYGPDLPVRFIYPTPNLDPNYLPNYQAALGRLETTTRIPAGQSVDHHYAKPWLLQGTSKPW